MSFCLLHLYVCESWLHARDWDLRCGIEALLR